METGYVTFFLHWIVVLMPALFLYEIQSQYRSVLWGRLLEIKSIISQGKNFHNVPGGF